MQMRSTKLGLGTLVLAVLVSGAAQGQTYTAGSGFTNSPHDFSGIAAGNAGNPTATTGGCTFCHTPHRAQQQALLWNHTLSSNTFSWDAGAVTAGGTPYPTIDTTWKGPTKLCLSCHDGSVAIGDIAWFNKQAWTGAAALDPTTHDVDVFNIADSTTGSMTGNHPVAFPYPFQQTTTNTYNGVTTGANVFVSDFNPDPTSLGIRLFNDNAGNISAGAVAGSTGIECSSCHGVHNERTLVFDRPLLRGTLGGSGTGPGASYICQKCHDRG
jgi:hypothetical protein